MEGEGGMEGEKEGLREEGRRESKTAGRNEGWEGWMEGRKAGRKEGERWKRDGGIKVFLERMNDKEWKIILQYIAVFIVTYRKVYEWN